MQWIDYVAYLFGGAFLTNAVPHFVSGMMGRPFQSPFAKPPGEGLSSSTVNVLWGSISSSSVMFSSAASVILDRGIQATSSPAAQACS